MKNVAQWQRILPLTITFGLMASCGNAPDDPGPGGVSNADAQALDKAAAKLDRVDNDEYRKQVDAPPAPSIDSE